MLTPQRNSAALTLISETCGYTALKKNWTPMHHYIKLRNVTLHMHFLRPVISFSRTCNRKWIQKSATMLHKFLDKVKYLTGIHRLKANTKQELLSITMQYSKTVSQYYQQIFRLWEHAGMPADKHIEKFICTLRPLISTPLLSHYYTDIKDLLDKARNIEDIKKDIVVNFPKQEKFGTSRLN